MMIKTAKFSLALSLLILMTFNLSACYDSMYLDEPTHRVNRSYGFYQFYDCPQSYYPNPCYDNYYNSPFVGSYYNNQQIEQRVYNNQSHHYYNHGASVHPRHHSNHQQQNYAGNNGYDEGVRAGRRNEQERAREAQISSDRALAQRLQNEEIAAARRETQIASDRALAERLQAEEYARAGQ